MLTIHKIAASDATGLSRYYEQLGREDYYTQGGEPQGYWLGSGAEKLGLSGSIDTGQLLRAMQGFHPETEKAIAKNAGDGHAPGWDATFSAPKSVSAVWAVADPHIKSEIQQAQADAVSAAISYLEREAIFTRHGEGGREREPVNLHGGLIVAAYEHSTSRNADPQLHTHCIINNMTPDGRGIDLDTRHKMVAGALYRVELAHQLQTCGFAVERDGDNVKVVGVPDALIDRWSSRHAEVRQSMAEKGLDSYVASKVAVLDTRETKGEINRPILFDQWRAEAREFNFSREQVALLKQHTPATSLDKPGPERILNQVTEHNSTVSRLQLLHRVAVESQGAMSARCAELHFSKVTAHPEAVPLTDTNGAERWTTLSMQRLEQAMADRAVLLAGQTSHQVHNIDLSNLAEKHNLSQEQQRAVQYLTHESGAVACIQGHAGTGKSRMLGVAREVWQNSGYSIHGVALSGKAAEGLQQSSGITSQTLHSLLHDLKQDTTHLDPRSILVVDEAGMVGSRQMSSLLRHADNAGAKVVLVGDSRQLQAIDAGAAFRAMHDRIGGAELSDIRRQRHEADRELVRALRDGRAADALQNLDKRGLLHRHSTQEQLREKVVNHYLQDLAQGKESLMLAGTRYEATQLNQLARQHCREAGYLRGDDVAVVTSVGERYFAAGDRVVFLRNNTVLEVKNGTTGIVQSVDAKTLTVRLADGSERTIEHQRGYSHVDHSYSLTVHKGQGVTVDRAHVVVNEMGGREWNYVAASRTREETRIYTTEARVANEHTQGIERSELAKEMSRSHAKDTTLDYGRDGSMGRG